MHVKCIGLYTSVLILRVAGLWLSLRLRKAPGIFRIFPSMNLLAPILPILE